MEATPAAQPSREVQRLRAQRAPGSRETDRGEEPGLSRRGLQACGGRLPGVRPRPHPVPLIPVPLLHRTSLSPRPVPASPPCIRTLCPCPCPVSSPRVPVLCPVSPAQVLLPAPPSLSSHCVRVQPCRRRCVVSPSCCCRRFFLLLPAPCGARFQPFLLEDDRAREDAVDFERSLPPAVLAVPSQTPFPSGTGFLQPELP